jgi:hypothetical protein
MLPPKQTAIIAKLRLIGFFYVTHKFCNLFAEHEVTELSTLWTIEAHPVVFLLLLYDVSIRNCWMNS